MRGPSVPTGPTWRNWGRNVVAQPAEVARPRSVEEVVALVVAARERARPLKVVGSGHSFTAIAATPDDGVLVDVSALAGLRGVDVERHRATLGAGTPLHRLPELLGPHGLALENMGDIDRQTIAGATSTGTHGTGARFRGLADQVVGATIVTADGATLRVDDTSHPDLLPAVRLGLGALGILVELTVQCVPAFLLRAEEGSAELDAVLDDFDAHADGADHFECYWWPGTTRVATKRNTRLPVDTPFTPPARIGRWIDQRVVQNGLLRAVCEVGVVAPTLTPALNRAATRVLGSSDHVDHSHAVFASPRHVRFRECEYAVAREALPTVVRELRALLERTGAPISFPVEIRVAAADDTWLSTAYGRDTGYVAVHRYHREDHLPYFTAVDALMRRHGGRPHWGKIHFQSHADLARAYPRFGDFLAVRERLDPDRLFTNDYLRRVLGR